MKMDARQTVNILNVGSYLVKFEFKLSNQMEKKKKNKHEVEMDGQTN